MSPATQRSGAPQLAAVGALERTGAAVENAKDALGDLGAFLFDTEEKMQRAPLHVRASWRAFALAAHRWMARRVARPQLDTATKAREWLKVLRAWREIAEVFHG